MREDGCGIGASRIGVLRRFFGGWGGGRRGLGGEGAWNILLQSNFVMLSSVLLAQRDSRRLLGERHRFKSR